MHVKLLLIAFSIYTIQKNKENLHNVSNIDYHNINNSSFSSNFSSDFKKMQT